MIGRFLLGSGLGALVGTGLLAIVSVTSPVPGAAHSAAANSNEAPAGATPDSSDAAPVLAESGAEIGTGSGTAATEEGIDAGTVPQPAEGAAVTAGGALPEETATEDPPGAAEGGADSLPDPQPEPATADILPGPPTAEAPEAPQMAALDEGGPAAPADAAGPAVAAAPEAPAELAGESLPAPAEVPAAGPAIADAPAPDAPSAPAAETAEVAAPGDMALADLPEAAPSQPDLPASEASPAAVEPPGLPPLTPEEEAMLAQIAAEGPGSALPPGETAPDAVDPAAEAAPAEETAKPKLLTEREDDRIIRLGEEPSTLPPTPALSGDAPGVVTGRLPRAGDSAEAAPAEAPAPDLRPIMAYAADFENPDNKPAFAIVLIDDGGAGTDRAALAALPFPVTFALDPSDPMAGQYAAIYRAAGKEVAILASALPKGGQASDIEVALSVMTSALPETVAVMDLPQRAFQNDRPLATLVVPAIGTGGRGVLTWDQGLNAADQVARREDIPAAVAFRDLDGADESGPVIRRYLDRAAFKAAQEGRVTVVGRARPETVAALLEWAVEGRAATVALAPLTAVLSVD